MLKYILNGWVLSIGFYVILIIVTFIPIMLNFFAKTNAAPPDLYSNLSFLQEEEKNQLKSNLQILYPEISYWHKYYKVYSALQLYSLAWTILASVLVPILAQAIDTTIESKWFLTLVSIHASVLLAFNKGLSVEDRMQMYRDGENDFNDLNRRFLINHEHMGENPHEKMKNYFQELEDVINTVRMGESKKVVLPEPSTVQAPGTGGTKK